MIYHLEVLQLVHDAVGAHPLAEQVIAPDGKFQMEYMAVKIDIFVPPARKQRSLKAAITLAYKYLRVASQLEPVPVVDPLRLLGDRSLIERLRRVKRMRLTIGQSRVRECVHSVLREAR